MSDTLATYRHSGKFNAQGLALCVIAAAIVAFPLGLAYAYLIRWVPFIYVNFLATLGYGFAFGWMTTQVLKFTQVRNTALAALCGLLAGVLALYGEWSGHLHALFDEAPWLFRPDEIMRGMQVLYAEGSWGLRSSGNVTGIVLAIVWVIEAGMILGFSILLPWSFVKDTPFCERSKCWLDEEKKIDTLESFTDAAQLAALKSGDLLPLIDAKPKADSAATYTRLLLKRSPQCTTFCTVRVQDVTVSIDNEGKVKEDTEDHTGDLILPASMFDLVVKFEEFKPTISSSNAPKVPAGM
jgi:hypothetical protein